jgi:MoaA/NifB/PqqE/SkfB family radical SAM enzyme
LPDGSSFPVHTVRVNFHCNQACHFCFDSTHLPAASDERIRAAVRDAGRAGAILALSGGEPTLNSRLVEYVRLGRECAVREIELQTNATRLAEGNLARELARAGVDVAFVSLHGPTPEISDAVTAAPGTFERTVRGVDAAIAAGIRVRLNFVFCELNRGSFPDLVRLVAARWPRAELAVSFVAPSTDLVPRERWLIPRYSDVLASLADGVRIANERGVTLTGFESMCGLPLCLVPPEFDRHLGLAEVPSGLDRGEFVKPEPCGQCALSERCWGLRRGYAELYGTSELRPVQ